MNLRMVFVTGGFLLLAAIMGSTEAIGADTRRVIGASAIPLQGASFASFVPPGWRIESAVAGDLNRDSIPDAVLELIEDLPAMAEGAPIERYRALLVLLKTPANRFLRLAVAGRLLRCSTCFGMMAGPEGGGGEIKINKGVLIIEQFWGSRETAHVRLRFRYDGTSNRMVLIGEDIERFDRATGAHRRESANFLTGVRLSRGARYDSRTGQLIKIPEARQNTPRAQRGIEEIDYQDYDRQEVFRE